MGQITAALRLYGIERFVSCFGALTSRGSFLVGGGRKICSRVIRAGTLVLAGVSILPSRGSIWLVRGMRRARMRVRTRGIGAPLTRGGARTDVSDLALQLMGGPFRFQLLRLADAQVGAAEAHVGLIESGSAAAALETRKAVSRGSSNEANPRSRRRCGSQAGP